MEIFKRLNPEFRRKLNITLLALAGLQFFSILILSVFFSDSNPVPVPKRSYEPVAIKTAPVDKNEVPVAASKTETPARAPQSVSHAKGGGKYGKVNVSKVRIAKKIGVARKLPPLKVAKQVQHAKPGKRPSDGKVVAKAPVNGAVPQADRW